MEIILDPTTKKFIQVSVEGKSCFICSNSENVDDHHIDLKHGKISDKTVPLCRRCHSTMHWYNGIHMFDDDKLDKAIEVWNMTQELYGRPLMTKDKIVRSNYWLKKHEVKKTITYDPKQLRFNEEVILEGKNGKGNNNGSFR